MNVTYYQEADMQADFLHVKHYCSEVVFGRPGEATLSLGFMMDQPG